MSSILIIGHFNQKGFHGLGPGVCWWHRPAARNLAKGREMGGGANTKRPMQKKWFLRLMRWISLDFILWNTFQISWCWSNWYVLRANWYVLKKGTVFLRNLVGLLLGNAEDAWATHCATRLWHQWSLNILLVLEDLSCCHSFVIFKKQHGHVWHVLETKNYGQWCSCNRDNERSVKLVAVFDLQAADAEVPFGQLQRHPETLRPRRRHGDCEHGCGTCWSLRPNCAVQPVSYKSDRKISDFLFQCLVEVMVWLKVYGSDAVVVESSAASVSDAPPKEVDRWPDVARQQFHSSLNWLYILNVKQPTSQMGCCLGTKKSWVDLELHGSWWWDLVPPSLIRWQDNSMVNLNYQVLPVSSSEFEPFESASNRWFLGPKVKKLHYASICFSHLLMSPTIISSVLETSWNMFFSIEVGTNKFGTWAPWPVRSCSDSS